MADYVRVGKRSEFEDGKILSFDVNGQAVVVVSWHDRFFAFSNECTHIGAPLNTGWITDKDEIVCTLHDSVFDMATGKILDGPAFDPLAVFTVRVEGDDVYVGKD